MDDLDAALLREICRDRLVMWGGMDLRMGASTLAERLDVDRTTVWSRLKAWEVDGFLVRHEIVPNPWLFGSGVAGGDIRVSDPREKPRVIESLKLVDGLLAGFDQLGEWIVLIYANESRAALDRCTRLLGELPGIDEVSLCVPFHPPPSDVTPTDRDWRILAALRNSHGTPLSKVAKEAGLSRRTFTRRYAALLDGHAIWSFPVFDFSRYRGASMVRFVTILDAPGTGARFVNACQRGLPEAVWFVPLDQLVESPSTDPSWVDVYCHLESPGDAERVEQWLLALPHVEAVEIHFPKAWFMVTDWFDERIQARLGRVPRAGA